MITAKNLIEDNYASVQIDDSVSKAVGELKKKNSSEALVFDGDQFRGVVSFRELFKNHDQLEHLKVGKIISIPPKVDSGASLNELAKLMLDSNFRMLPVFDHGNMIGVVSAGKVVKFLKSMQPVSSKKISELMSKNALTITEDEQLDKTISLMKSRKIKKLPVLNVQGRVTGMLTWENILENYLVSLRHSNRGQQLFFGKKSEDTQTVSSLVNSKLPMVSSKDTLESAMDQWPDESSNPYLLVVDNQKFSGIVTTKDLLKLFVDSQPVNKNIHFIDLPDSVDDIDLAELNNLVNREYDKLERHLGENASLTVHFKSHHVLGLRRKYSIHCRAVMNNKTVFFRAEGWKLIQTCHDALKGLEKVVLKNLKSKR